MRGFANNCSVVAVSNDEAGVARQVTLFLEDLRQVRRHGPKETVAITKIIGPFAVAEKIGLGDLDFDDREAALPVDRHQIGAATIGQRHLAYCEQILSTEEARYAPRDFGGNWRGIRETGGLGDCGHGSSRTKRGQKGSGGGQILQRFARRA